MAQRPKNRDKRQTRRDPTEIGSNADAALLSLGGAAAGASAAVVGEDDAGERLTPIISNPKITKDSTIDDKNNRQALVLCVTY